MLRRAQHIAPVRSPVCNITKKESEKTREHRPRKDQKSYLGPTLFSKKTDLAAIFTALSVI